MKTRPLLVTRVRLQLYMKEMTTAVITREKLCKSIDSLSEIPICRMLAVMVMIAAV